MAGENGNKKKIIGIVLVLMFVGIISYVLFYLNYRKYHVQTDDASIDGKIYTVTPQIGGKVAELLVDDNQQVEQGQTLVKLDTSDIEAQLNTARQNLDVVKNQIAGQYASIKVVDAQMKQLGAQLELVTTERKRIEELLQKGAVAADDYDKIQAQWKALNAQMTASRKQKSQIRTAIGPKNESGKEAAIRLAEANIAQLELQLQHTIITAPVSGYITRRSVTIGQVVQPSQPLMAVVPLNELYITANYKETELTYVQPGMAVSFKVDAYPGHSFKGRVESIMAGTGSVFSLLPPQNATGNYIKVVQRIPVKIDILEHDAVNHPFRLGMSVVPTILVKGQ